MTRGEAKQLLPIIQALAEGKVIECRAKTDRLKGVVDIPSKWTETKEILCMNCLEYRIKPEQESKYRPFKDAEECWQEMQKHQPIGWTYDYTNNIWDSIARVTGSGIVYEEDMMCFEDVFNRVKFADGTPFGVKIKE